MENNYSFYHLEDIITDEELQHIESLCAFYEEEERECLRSIDY